MHFWPYALGAAAALVLLAVPAEAANITNQDWGTTPEGKKVELFTLKGAGGLEARISNFGGRIVNLYVPNAHGSKTDIELGLDDLDSYLERGGAYGAIIGRYVGRISHGGNFPLDGKIYQLEKTNPNAKFVIHGGTAAFSRQIWAWKMQDGGEPSLMLSLTSSDGDGGFPGTVRATVTYTLTRDNALKIDYRATSDRPTPVNFTNHSYFALQSEGNGDVSNQMLRVYADKYLPQDDDNLVTGKIASVDGTPLDFRKPVRIGDVLHSDFPQIAMRQGLDICMIVNGKPGVLRPAVKLSDPGTGIVMEVATTQPAVQLYSDGIGDRTSLGRGGKIYRTFYSMSLETEGYLDAPNNPNFPPSEVTPDRPYHETTIFHFSTN